MFNIKTRPKTEKLYPNIFDLILYILFFFLFSIVALFIAENISNLLGEFIENITGFKIFLSYVLSLTLTALAMHIYRTFRTSNHKHKIPLFDNLKFKPFSPLLLLWGTVLTFASSVVADPVINLFPDSNQQINEIISSMGSYAIWCTVFAAPLLEEIIFRAVFLSDIEHRYGTFIAITISSLIFALIHFNAAQSLSALLMGVVLGYVYIASQSLWCAIAIHAINNAFALTLSNLFPDMESWKYLIKSDLAYNIIYIISAVIIAIMFVNIIRLCRRRDGKIIKNSK